MRILLFDYVTLLANVNTFLGVWHEMRGFTHEMQVFLGSGGWGLNKGEKCL
jgi:hypothetical protein